LDQQGGEKDPQNRAFSIKGRKKKRENACETGRRNGQAFVPRIGAKVSSEGGGENGESYKIQTKRVSAGEGKGGKYDT